MNRFGIAAAALALALLTYFQFPGHTWLQQDSQIYVPILEHLNNSTVLVNDPLVERSHVAYTLYDEIAIALHRITHLPFREILSAEQIITRALGVWGLFLMAQALGLTATWSMAVAAIVSLGAAIAGPAVLTFEYEPTPRAFATPLIFCAIGLAAHRRDFPASIAASVAFLYHPPTTAPFWVVFLALTRAWRPLIPLAVAAAAVALGAATQGAPSTPLLARLTPADEQLLRLRASYIWISTWPAARIRHHIIAALLVAAAIWRVRPKAPLRTYLIALPALGLLTMPVSWLVLEHYKLWLAPLLQPLRVLLFTTLAMQFLAAAAGALAVQRSRRAEGAAWFALAFLVPLQPVLTDPYTVRRTSVDIALAAATAITPAAIPAAYFAIPVLGRVTNYPKLHTPELAQLSVWARTSTPDDAVFLFPDAGRSLDPGIFRAEALRTVYVDWKAGGQANYIRDFGERWWFRWQQTTGAGFRPDAIPRYEALGVTYIVLRPGNRQPRSTTFENAQYLVYDLHAR